MVLREERTGIEKKFFDLSEKIAKENNLSVYDMDYLPGSQELRLYIIDDNTDTAVIEDCIKIDKAFDEFLEEEWMPEALNLEVSSPGMFRPLKSLGQFKKAVGENILVQLKSRVDVETFPSAPKKIVGEKKIKVALESMNEDGVIVKYDDFEMKLNFTDIKKANLEPDY